MVFHFEVVAGIRDSLLVGRDGCIEDLLSGGQLAESVIDTPGDVLQHRVRVVRLAVDIQGDVVWFHVRLVRVRHQVQCHLKVVYHSQIGLNLDLQKLEFWF